MNLLRNAIALLLVPCLVAESATPVARSSQCVARPGQPSTTHAACRVTRYDPSAFASQALALHPDASIRHGGSLSAAREAKLVAEVAGHQPPAAAAPQNGSHRFSETQSRLITSLALAEGSERTLYETVFRFLDIARDVVVEVGTGLAYEAGFGALDAGMTAVKCIEHLDSRIRAMNFTPPDHRFELISTEGLSIPLPSHSVAAVIYNKSLDFVWLYAARDPQVARDFLGHEEELLKSVFTETLGEALRILTPGGGILIKFHQPVEKIGAHHGRWAQRILRDLGFQNIVLLENDGTPLFLSAQKSSAELGERADRQPAAAPERPQEQKIWGSA